MPSEGRRARSYWTWTPPTTRCTASRRAVSSTASTATTAICRCTSSAGSSFCAPGCAARTSMPRRGRSTNCSASWRRSGPPGRACASFRADSGFAREEIMAWCEAHAVDYVLGLAKNARLKRALSKELRQAKRDHARTGAPARVFKDFTYKTRKSWSRRRRVVGKAEHLSGGPNPRFVVTSISREDTDARALYEDVYCARGDMENRIKEQQLGLFADRTSTATMRANQIRLWLSSVAYVLLHALRRLGLRGTALAKAQCDTIRLKLLKIGAQVRVTVRKIWVSLASGSPYATTFGQTYQNLLAAPLRC